MSRKPAIRLTFLGGVGTVTGSKYLLDVRGRRILIDCGLFQGYKTLRQRNWSKLPVPAASIDAVLLTHAHLDHSGYVPLLIRHGFSGPVHCTLATRDLCKILLPDSGYLQEKDANYANSHGFSKHHPALPLYTAADAEASLKQFAPVNFNFELDLGDGVSATFTEAGHILGAACITISANARRIVFSGDLGRPDGAPMRGPAAIAEADFLIVESTYGNRRHGDADPAAALASIIERTVARGGTVLIPSFAVGRAQTLLYHLHTLKSQGRLGTVPVFLDSPMAISASELFRIHADCHRLTPDQARDVCNTATYVRDAEDSKALLGNPMPKIVISASGMATGGRVLHHLKALAPDRRNTILFAGFQAGGTRGQKIVAGAEAVKIHGQYVPIKAEVANLDTLSAHADADEILGWLKGFAKPPRMTFVTHGEADASDALRIRIGEELGWDSVSVPEPGGKAALR